MSNGSARELGQVNDSDLTRLQFVDDNGNIHEGNIEAIAAVDITRGCNPPANDRFCPGSSVTRGQMAAFLVRALDLPVALKELR